MKVYLAGPMRGYPDNNFPAFHAAAAELRAKGYEVFNPAENDEKMLARGEELTIRNCLRLDLEWICTEAEAIVLMPGWQASKGAQAERATAIAIGLEILALVAV
jgi:nucleoside 2-deoxyribosyltransferase